VKHRFRLPFFSAPLALTALLVAAFPTRAETPVSAQVTTAAVETPLVPKAAVPASAGLGENTAATKIAAPLAGATDATPVSRCGAPADLARLARPLTHTAHLLAAGAPVKIVAIGSSSTAGAGASSPAASYPSRLAVELGQRFPGEFTVLNRGVNGEEAADMLARFDTSVIAEKPDLVLWQVGTNAVLRDQPLASASPLIEEGIAQLRAIGADVILIDPQFAPKVIAKPEAEGMVKLIAGAAKQYSVNLFQRFAVMRHWRERDGMAFDAFVSPDQLHMNDWSYACVAKVLSASIIEAATRPTTSASAQTTR
jgi:hypothetical protein